MPEMNYSALRGRIRDCGLTQKEVASRIGISAGEFVFRQDEIDRIIALLNIDPIDIGRYFFSPKS